jgi:regulator of protease activity HflC (stomatin/prohibitin superfamily)
MKNWIKKWYTKKPSKKKPSKEPSKMTKGELLSMLLVLFAALYTVIGFFVVFETGGKNWMFFVKIGIPVWLFTTLVFAFRRIRPQAEDLEQCTTALIKEIDDLGSLIERRCELTADYDYQVFLLGKLEKKEEPNTKAIEDQRKVRDQAHVRSEEYYRKVLRPRKRYGKNIFEEYYDESKGSVALREIGEKREKAIYGITTLKEKIRNLERNRVTMYDMPFVGSFFILFLFTIFWAVPKFLDGKTLGGYSWLTAICLILLLITYFIISIEKVLETHRGIWFFLGRAVRLIDRGFYLVPKALAGIIQLPRTINWYDVTEYQVMLTAEDEMQTITVNISVPWWISDWWDVIVGIGSTFPEIKERLEGGPADPEKNKKASKSMIGDICNRTMRAFVADEKQIRSLKDALKMQAVLATRIQFSLKENLNHLGISTGEVQVVGVDPGEEVLKEIDKAYAAEKRILRVQKDAVAVVAEADGQAKKDVKLGDAARDVKKAAAEATAFEVEKAGEATAKALLARLTANVDAVAYLKEKKVTDEMILSLITALLLGEKSITDVADALKGMDINLVAVPYIGEFFESLSSYLKKLASKAVV